MRCAHFWLLPWLSLATVMGCVPASTETAVPPAPSVVAKIEATATPPAVPTVPPQPIPSLLQCDAPYAEDSIWNTPIDWQRARIHPQSPEMMAAFFDGDSWIGSNVDQYAPNIYYVYNHTLLVNVTLRDGRSFRDALSGETLNYGEAGGVVAVPIPLDARPAPGSDGELVVVNVDTGVEWGMFQASQGLDGSWSAGGVYRYHITNSGMPPQGFAQRGAGLGALAGIVRPCEVERGEIRHALTIAYDYPCAPETCAANGWPAFIPPFTKTDGVGHLQYDLPEGARLVIRPEIPDDQIMKACGRVRGCFVWVKAMQTYGGFVVDNSGHPKTYAEGNQTAHWDAGLWTSDMLRNIPSDWYAVLDWNVVIH